MNDKGIKKTVLGQKDREPQKRKQTGGTPNIGKKGEQLQWIREKGLSLG